MAWYIDENLGLYNDEFFPIPEYAIICPVSPAIFHIDPLANSGFPYCDLMIGIPRLRIKIVEQDPYVSVYDISSQREDFNGNGAAILCPTECRVHQVENGEWSVRMKHPMDENGKWQYLRERNYIKVLGQIFTIISVETDFTNRMLYVYAEHVFYTLNDAFILASVNHDAPRYISGDSGQEIITDIMVSAAWYSPPPYTVFAFQYYSDIPTAAFQLEVPSGGMTPVQAILGGGGMCEITGGKLFRDNFYFSVNEQMEDALEDAFDLRIGNNLHGITRKIDTSSMATWCRVDDGAGNCIAVSWGTAWQTLQALPHNIVRATSVSLKEPDMDVLWAQTCAFFSRSCAPVISYKFDIRDSIADELYSDIQQMYRYEVGDSGQLYDERLGGAFTLTITETEKDGITGRTLSFTVGNSRSFVRSGSAPPVNLPTPQEEMRSFVWRDKNGVILRDKNNAVLHTEVNRNGN